MDLKKPSTYNQTTNYTNISSKSGVANDHTNDYSKRNDIGT